jgi:large subunit ribosomal protein L10
MTREEKTTVISELKEKFENNPYFYFTDSSTLTVDQVNKLRSMCYEKGVEMKVIKNTLAKKALLDNAEEKGFTPLLDVLKGPTTVMFADTANVPAKLIKEFRKTFDRPVLKAAYIDAGVYVGDDQVDALAALKSKDELVGDIILLLQSPMKNVVGSLLSGGNTIAGLLKALEERAQ